MPRSKKLLSHFPKKRRNKARSLAMKAAWARRKAMRVNLQFTGSEPPAALLEAPEQPIRAQVLDAAKALTMGDRNKLYGSPLINLETQGKLREAFWNAAGPEHRFTAWGSAMEMVLCKLARIASAPTREAQLFPDHTKDMINYLAISQEVAESLT